MRPRVGRSVGLAVSCAALAALGAAPAAPTPGPGTGSPSGVSVVPVPSSPHLSGNGQRLDFGRLDPGASASDRVIVRNIGDSPATVELYAADAFTAAGGGLAFGLRGDPATGVGRWLRLTSSRVVVPARGGVEVGLTVTVPARLPGGEYAGGIVAEQAAPPPASGGGVRQVFRFAMAVYLTVPGGAPGATPGRGSPDGKVQVVDVGFPTRDGKVCPRVTYRNEGQRIVNPDAQVTVDPRWLGGERRTRYTGIGAVLPEAVATVTLPCQDLPVAGGRVSLTLTGPEVDASGGQRSVDIERSVLPLVLALLLLLLLIALLTWWVLRERRRRLVHPNATPLVTKD